MNIFKRLALVLLLILSANCSWCLSADSLVRWNEISFATSFEEQAFRAFLKENNKDYLRLFLVNSPTADQDLKLFERRINETLEEINTSGSLKKKNEKKIKYIYDLVHSRFLIKYEAENRFYEIARTGNYNCVTATALYALFFDKLSIPYAIKEEPTHVYLVAYPNEENILVETTTPISGFRAFDDAYKLDYINTLKSQKLIGSSETTSSNIDELFNKYYFGNENITLTQLIGIHFLNDCLFNRDHDQMSIAYEQIKKAYLYYPNTRSEYLLMGFTADRLEAADVESINKAILIGRISRFKKVGITNDMIIGEFQNLTQAILSKRNDKDLYRKCYLEVIRNIDDTELTKEISYMYYYENGRIFYNQGNYTRAKPFFAQALKIQPNNVDLGGIFISCLGQSFRNERNNTAIVDSLESYKKQFESLGQNNNFNSMLGMAYVIEFGNSIEKGNVTNAEKYQKLFEELYYSDKNINLVSPDAVGNAYSEASVYYFKKGQKAKAKQVLESGLRIVPGNYQLKARKQMIN